MEIQELDDKIAQLEVLVKQNTCTLIKDFNQFSMFMNELLQGHSKQPYCSKLDEAKSLKRGN